jgi:FixJ family two-component response regulator
MPGMTGNDLARRILQIRPGMPIILCTGFSNLISEEKARSYGIKGFAMKPLAKRDLAFLVRKVLDGEKTTWHHHRHRQVLQLLGEAITIATSNLVSS